MAGILRLRVEEGKLIREWERRGDRIAKLYHENTMPFWQEGVEAQGRQAEANRGTAGSGDRGTDFLIVVSLAEAWGKLKPSQVTRRIEVGPTSQPL